MKRKPNIFIGSSREALPLARRVASELRRTCAVQVWDERLFELGEDTLTGLLRAVRGFDFAVLVLADDDTLVSKRSGSQTLASTKFGAKKPVDKARLHKYAVSRDNVILELGMFLGAMGRRKAFALVAPSDRGEPKIPSDLFGTSLAYLKSATVKSGGSHLLRVELGHLIETIHERFSNEADFELLPSTGSAVSYFHNFVLPVCEELSKKRSIRVNGRAVDISNDKFCFRIVMPGSLTEANRPYAQKLFKGLPVTEFTVKSTHRSFPFWVSTSLEDGRVVFWDYPTILRSSDEAIRYVTRGAYLARPAVRKQFEAKELGNFEKCIRLQLSCEAAAAPFRDNIEIKQSNEV